MTKKSTNRYVVRNKERDGCDVTTVDTKRASAHTDREVDAIERARTITGNFQRAAYDRRMRRAIAFAAVAVFSTGASMASAHPRGGMAKGHHQAAPADQTAADQTPVPSDRPFGPIVDWRAAGSQPLSDADAARRVASMPENRPVNANANNYQPGAAELGAFRHGQQDRYGRDAVAYNPLAAYVTGGFSGTTDEILQWVAHKWGIPENVVRSVAVNESSWRMSHLGDRHTVDDPGRYPAYSRIAGTSDVYQSLGIMQIKWTPEGLHQGTESLRWRSTAFNADYWGAVVRYYYDGLCYWCDNGYSAGQEWASVGAWFSPSPWVDGSLAYVESAKSHMAARPWASFGF